MPVVRRVYLYLVSGVSLAMLLVGLGNGGGALLEALTAGSLAATFRQTLALSASLVLVGLPVWLFHWRKALQLAGADPEERAAALRRLYFYVVTAFTIVAMAVLGTNLIQATIGRALDLRGHVDLASATRSAWHLALVTLFWLYHIRMEVRERALVGENGAASALRRLYVYAAAGLLFWLVAWLASRLLTDLLRPLLPGGGPLNLASTAEAAWGLLITLVFWAYHLHIAAENRGRVGERGGSATLRRWYVYGVQFFALATLLFGVRELMSTLALSAAQMPVPRDTALAAIFGTSVVACAAWLGHARWSARGGIAEDDRHSTLRAVSGFGVVALAVGVTLYNASRALYFVLTSVLGVSGPRWGAGHSLPDGLSETLPYVLVFGAAWALMRRWLANDAVDAEWARQAGVRRLYTHMVSLIGVMVLASGASGLLWTLLDQATSRGPGTRPDAWIDPASLFATFVLVGLPAWLAHWRPNPQIEERGAMSRRLYVVASLLVAVLALLASGASVIERVLSAIMGAGAGVPTLTLMQSVSVGLVALAVLAYHWRVLARDNALRPAPSEIQREEPIAELAGLRLLVEIVGATEVDVRQALAQLPHGASFAIRPASSEA